MFGGYATHWVADRRLEPRSRELYAMLLRLHIMPWFGDLALDRITPPMVRFCVRVVRNQPRQSPTACCERS
jgi:Phage integrase, N-terminal SAM-like domain